MSDKTITIDRSSHEDARPLHAFLTAAFVASHPRRRPMRFSLAGIETVRIQRGPEDAYQFSGRALTIDASDSTMSRPHATLTHDRGEWRIEDHGSKNGTLIDGQRVASAELQDGDAFTLGNTTYVLRRSPAQGGPRVFEGGSQDRPAGLCSMHPGLEQVFDRLVRVATTSIPILVLGETGTGKELVARAVHELSRRPGAFVAINCGAIPEGLLAAEMFGTRRGAFSGATTDRPGLIRAADRGTLLLDEIGEMPLPSQVALLRVLQEQTVVPVGGTTPIAVDVRFVAATHRDLERLAMQGRFREDLLARLAGLVVPLPPLRERREDTGLILSHLLADLGAPDDVSFSPSAGAALFTRPWRRNIRQLRQMLSVALASGATEVNLEHLGTEADEAPEPARADAGVGHDAVVPTTTRDLDRDDLMRLLTAHRWNLSAVARALSTSRTQVARLMDRYAIEKPTR